MRNFGIRLFTLTLCATALLAVPIITAAEAGANRGARAEKTRTKNQGDRPADVPSPGFGDMRSPTLATWPPPMYEDFDRRAGGGVGM